MRHLLRAVALLAVAACAGFAATASAEAPPGWFVDEAKLPFAALPGSDTTRYWGVHGAAGYRVEVPANWNGSLVLWAHGFRGSGLELTVDNHPLRAFLVANGYAWAASSYSRNGYDVKTGVQHADTDELLAWVASAEQPPRTVYVVHGESSASAALARRITDELGLPAVVPRLGEQVRLD